MHVCMYGCVDVWMYVCMYVGDTYNTYIYRERERERAREIEREIERERDRQNERAREKERERVSFVHLPGYVIYMS